MIREWVAAFYGREREAALPADVGKKMPFVIWADRADQAVLLIRGQDDWQQLIDFDPEYRVADRPASYPCLTLSPDWTERHPGLQFIYPDQARLLDTVDRMKAKEPLSLNLVMDGFNLYEMAGKDRPFDVWFEMFCRHQASGPDAAAILQVAGQALRIAEDLVGTAGVRAVMGLGYGSPEQRDEGSEIQNGVAALNMRLQSLRRQVKEHIAGVEEQRAATDRERRGQAQA